MNIQSISVVVPTKGCVNDCMFCVSKMHENSYEDHFDRFQIEKRLKFAINNKVNTCVITGTGEPLQNQKFLWSLSEIFDDLNHPFPNIELQTSGVMLMEFERVFTMLENGEIVTIRYTGGIPIYPNINLLKYLGVNTISLSVSDIFDNENNLRIVGVPKKLRFDLDELCSFIKKHKFNLRLSLNMTYAYNDKSVELILKRCMQLGADQITFRELYHSGDDSLQTEWVRNNKVAKEKLEEVSNYILTQGIPLYRLPFGPIAYSVMNMSTVVDDDCMSKENIDNLKYVILRGNGKLYCRWDDEGSLIF